MSGESVEVVDNPDERRFEARVGGALAGVLDDHPEYADVVAA